MSRSRAHSYASVTSKISPSRNRTQSNPWNRYADFFTNESFLIPDTITFAKILPFFKALKGYSSRYKITLVELVGYEAYFVEQWISSRSSNTLIVTYTGDHNDKIIAYHVQLINSISIPQPPPIHEQNPNVLQVSSNDPVLSPFENWPPRFISYLVDQLESPFCVATETSLGYAFITNLAQLSPFLTLVDAKTGNIVDDYTLYVVNYNLRKLGCGSRSVTTTDEPSKSVESKFKATFKIDSKIPINYAIINLISIVQTFLYYYGILDPVYCDGLFCEKTEAAIEEWWRIILNIPLATQLIKVKPPSATMPESIQAIIGFTILCRYLLELGGTTFSVPKDPNDIRRMKFAILKFQKHFKLEQTSTLNHETLIKLFDWSQTIKASQNLTKDLIKVKKLVKNTVIDITSGKNFQSIAQNASASPFHLLSRSNYDDVKMINCQNIENFNHMSVGKQLSYLLFNSGKPINLEKESLAIQTVKKIADSTSTGTIIDGVKRLKSQIGDSISPQKPKSTFAELKNLSTATLNVFDKDHETSILSDTESTDENNNEKAYKPNDIDMEKNLINTYYDDSNINKKIKKSKLRSSSLLSSDDELPPQRTQQPNLKRKDSLAGFDFDEYNDDVAIYNPTKKFGFFKSKNNASSRANSMGANNSDGYEDYDDYGYQNSENKEKGFSSHFKLSRRSCADKNNIDEVLIDDNYSDADHRSKSNLNSRRGTDAKDPKPNLKSFYTSPHVISTSEFSDPNTRLNSVEKIRNSEPNTRLNSVEKVRNSTSIASNSQTNDLHSSTTNDNESDGVYEYENGFEYDYELDSSISQSRKHSSLNSSKEHSRKTSAINIPKASNNLIPPKNDLNSHNYSTYSAQTNLTSANDSSLQRQSNSNIDCEYLKFMKRLKRRHSVPIVQCEMNKYAIEMKMKIDKLDREATSTLERRQSWLNNNNSVWDTKNRTNGGKLVGSKTNNDNESSIDNKVDYLTRPRNKSIFGAQSVCTTSSWDTVHGSTDALLIYHNRTENMPLRRCESFSILCNCLVDNAKTSDVYGFEFTGQNFITPEVLAMKYLKLEAKYQFDMVQRSFFLSRNLRQYSKFVLDVINREKNPSTCINIQYNNTRNDISKAIGKYYEIEDKVKNTVKNNARLKYELRLLLQKTKEVENNLKTLKDFKIKTLSERINKLSNGLNLESEDKSDNSKQEDHLIDKIYQNTEKLTWKDVGIKNIYNNPSLIIYLIFHFFLCRIFQRIDPKTVEQRWKKIDKNETVSQIIKKLYIESDEKFNKLRDESELKED